MPPQGEHSRSRTRARRPAAARCPGPASGAHGGPVVRAGQTIVVRQGRAPGPTRAPRTRLAFRCPAPQSPPSRPHPVPHHRPFVPPSTRHSTTRERKDPPPAAEDRAAGLPGARRNAERVGGPYAGGVVKRSLRVSRGMPRREISSNVDPGCPCEDATAPASHTIPIRLCRDPGPGRRRVRSRSVGPPHPGA